MSDGTGPPDVFDAIRGAVIDLPVGRILPGWVSKAAVIDAIDRIEGENTITVPNQRDTKATVFPPAEGERPVSAKSEPWPPAKGGTREEKHVRGAHWRRYDAKCSYCRWWLEENGVKARRG